MGGMANTNYNANHKSRNSADEDYHCFSGRIETDIEYDPEKDNGRGQKIPFVKFRMVSNASFNSFKPTAHYDCTAWNKTAARLIALGITRGYGLVCWAKYKTNVYVPKSAKTAKEDERKDVVVPNFEIQRFVIKTLPKAEREELLEEAESEQE
jgi:hypothetical protein